MFRKTFLRALSILVVGFLVGCAPASPLGVAGNLLQASFFPNDKVFSARLAPEFGFVRVEHQNRFSILALAYTEPARDEHGPTYVYVSGQRETLIIKDGLVEGFYGVDRQLSRDSSSAFLDFNSLDHWQPNASIDKKSGSVPSSISSRLFNPSGRVVRWSPILGGWRALYLDGNGWAYTHQCLAPDFCLGLQPWSATSQEKFKVR